MDTISIGKKPMVALSLAELPDSHGHLVLAMGGLDNKIHIYIGDRKGNVHISSHALFLCYTLPFILARSCRGDDKYICA